MNVKEHRQENVRLIIKSLDYFTSELEVNNEFELHKDEQFDVCIATGLMFLKEMAVRSTTYSNYGQIWTGLWMGSPVKLAEPGHGNTLFPRWLAEVLKQECGLTVKEEDIYDE